MAALVGLTAVAGCDISDPLEGVDLHLDITDAAVDVDLSVVLIPGEGNASEKTVSVPSDIDAVELLSKFTIQPEDFAYTPGTGDPGGGSVDYLVLIEDIPIPGMPLVPQVSGGQIASVSPTSLNLQNPTYDYQRIRDVIESTPEGKRPAIPSNFESLTPDDAVRQIKDAMGRGQFKLGVVARSSADLSGVINLRKFRVDGRVQSSG